MSEKGPQGPSAFTAESTYSHPQPPPSYEASSSSAHGAQYPGPQMMPGPQAHGPQMTGPQMAGPQFVPGPQMVQGQGVTVITTQPGITVIPGALIGTKPSTLTCSSCRCQIVTRVEYLPSIRTHLWAAILCFLGCWPCVCLPYCIDTCNNVDHYCPNCNAYIGTYQN